MDYQSTTNAPAFQNYAINTGPDGEYACYDLMLYRIRKHMDLMVARHNKVLFIRFDLRFPQGFMYDKSNDKVSLLFKTLREFYTYRGIDFQFLWFREQSKEKHQHYHCVILTDGNKIKDYLPVLHHITEIWGRLLQYNPTGLVDYCNYDRTGHPVENGIMIRRPSSVATGGDRAYQEQRFHEDFERCHKWASYLAKVNQKANTPAGMRRFGVSQIQLR